MKLIYQFMCGLAALLVIPSVMAQDNPLIRYAAVSPDGNKISFSYQGDIWTADINGQNPRRLTIHEAYEGRSIWSPDGKEIAFTGDRFGNNDLYTIPSEGGQVDRITFHSASDQLTDWTADGNLLFNSQRTFGYVEWESAIYSIPSKGGTPTRTMNAVGNNPVVSNDGRFIAFEMGPCRIEREAYQGSANRQIWVYDTQQDTYSQITTFEGQDALPQWAGDRTLYFLSTKSGRYNVWKQEISESGQAASEAEQITSFESMGVNWYNVNRSGSKMVLNRGNELYAFAPASKAPVKVSLKLAVDERFDAVVRKSFSGDMQEYAVSPNGKLSAFAVRGEVFIKKNDKEESKSVNISESAYRDEDIAWLNDSTLLFVSDREGQKDIYLARSTDKENSNLFTTLKREVVKVTNTKQAEHNLTMSPDGKKISYLSGNGKLVVADIDQNGKLSKEVALVDNNWSDFNGISWSPDSRYLAYSTPDLDFNNEVYIQPVDKSHEPVNISMHPRGDYSPVWSPDGSKLGFLSQRNNGDTDIWYVWLKKADWEKTKNDWKEAEDIEPKDKGSDKDKKKDNKEEVTPVEIDFDDIYERLVQVTAYPGDESSIAFSKDGKNLYFVRENAVNKNRELYTIKWDGDDAKMVTAGKRISGVSMDKKLSHIYFVDGGRQYRVKPSAGSSKESLPHSAKMKINYPEERKQMFEEGWTAIQEGFYDPNFHGQDWDNLKKTYRSLALSASTQTDFRYVFNLMLGQINASHMGLYRTEERAKTQREHTGNLGLEVKPHADGVEVTHVVDGAPASKENSKITEGDIILAVNGDKVEQGVNFYQTLTDLAGERILLTVKDKNKTQKEVVIRPVSRLGDKLYEEWVNEKRELVNKYSNGKLGYLHIEGMNWTSFERFERDLMAAGHGKEGIVIDVRYNGGGWTTDYLMAVLNVKQHAYTIPRGATTSLEENHEQFSNHYPYGERLPFAAWTKPSVALCNESSYSNAEIFSHAYKGLGIGTLVGRPTFGAVISTGGHQMIDGGLLRMPFRAWYTKSTGLNQELNGAVPDIIVHNAPDSYSKGEDEQLRKAVEVLTQKEQ
ncbi:S41 family peptidase [Limibacter armeniacum]|uniref:S41 family peptidase n=1 Tax=Limibacter armeniacum TaxID=466084 RepID=UPI002FE5460F